MLTKEPIFVHKISENASGLPAARPSPPAPGLSAEHRRGSSAVSRRKRDPSVSAVRPLCALPVCLQDTTS